MQQLHITDYYEWQAKHFIWLLWCDLKMNEKYGFI